jgi:hypothetical protein
MDYEPSGYITWEPERQQRYDAARARVADALTELVTIASEDTDHMDPPFIQRWMVSCEWTSIELERNDAGGRHVFAPQGQMLSVTAGLSEWAKTTVM